MAESQVNAPNLRVYADAGVRAAHLVPIACAARVYVGRDSKRSPISGPTRGKLFDQSVRRILIVSTVQCNCINDTYNVSTRRGVKETRVSRKFRNWRFFHARRFVENLSNIRDIRRRGILK